MKPYESPCPENPGGAAGRPVVVYDLAHAMAALQAASELGVPVTLRSAPGAADYLGSGGFRAIVELARERWPDVPVSAVLDCADAAGHALGAFRIGIPAVRFRGSRAVRRKLADIAAQQGARLDDDRRKALDLLGSPDPLAACRAWLSGSAGRGGRRPSRSASKGPPG